MRWFKHETSANVDAKLVKLRMRYGLEGYGLYWYCLEMIASSVEPHNITFELEHDAEVIAFHTGIHQDKIEQMMRYMVDVGLFEDDRGVITCLKMAKRMDSSMTSNPEMRKLIQKVRDTHMPQTTINHDGVMTGSCEGHDGVMTQSCQIDRKKERKNTATPIPKNFTLSTGVLTWASEKGHSDLEAHLENFILTCEAKGYRYKDWDAAFKRAVRDNWAKINNTATHEEKWQ